MQLGSTPTTNWRWVLLALVATHVLLALVYAARTPYRQSGVILGMGRAPANDIGAPDERQHANYIQHMLDGRGFPVFDPADPELYESYQSHQPPLYYMLAAGWAKVTGVADVAAPSAAMRLRAFSSMPGGATVAGVFFLCLWGMRRTDTALAAAAMTAALPMLCALDGAVGNDPLLIALCTWTLALCVRGLREGWTVGSVAVTAGVLGCALLTKTSAIALAPVCLYALAASQPKPSPRLWGVAAGVVLVLVTPWWLRNQQLYGDPLAMGAFGSAFSGTAQAKSFIETFGAAAYWTQWVGWWTLRSVVGVFGYMDIFLPSAVYAAVWALLVPGFVGAWARQRSAEDRERAALTAAWLFAAFVGALFLRFNAQYFQGQGRYLMPAIGAAVLLVATGWTHCAKGRTAGVWAISALLLACNLYALAILPQEFARRTNGSSASLYGSTRDAICVANDGRGTSRHMGVESS